MSNDPAYWTVDHNPPLADGGSLFTGMKPAHKGCNSSEGGKLGHAWMLAARGQTAPPATSQPRTAYRLPQDAHDLDDGWERSRAW
ncbi:hypothetical protein SAMN04489747_3464 [Auraticoccus monumenti]|uniref:HNH endonuclease n=2 Tax=Auraticoccus monumenti TaxID=675864 RepID=A0A1G7D4I6_9ACTN|nr:hypothetical protein SAMN04489747_3464 [Auraticoccus monumenti]